MRITKARLRQIIREELQHVLEADDADDGEGDGEGTGESDAGSTVAEAEEKEEGESKKPWEKEKEESPLDERLRRALLKHLGK